MKAFQKVMANIFLFHKWSHCPNATNAILCMKVIQMRSKNFMRLSDLSRVLYVNNYGKRNREIVQMLCTCYYPVSQ